MRFRYLLLSALILGAFVLFGAAHAQQNPVVLGRTAILTGDAARPLFKQCSRSSPGKVTGYWTPTAADLKQFEPKLRAYLKTVKLPDTANVAASYYCQCVGFMRNGHKFIYVNAFHPHVLTEMEQGPSKDEKRFDWRRDPVDVCDGGDDFFGVEYDVANKKFQRLAWNGMA